VGCTLLEAVNFLEHYGMLRQRVGVDGRYERVLPSHSWNSNNIATNVLIYHLQRHSDHHANPTRRYQALRDYEESPVLPTGYAGMILLALVPPLWRRVMDPRVRAHYGGDLALANLSPRKRATIEAASAKSNQGDHHRHIESGGQPLAPSSSVVYCPGCNYRYDEQRGDPREGFPIGTPWSLVPESWCCPDCGVCDKSDFIPIAPTLGKAL